MPRKTSTQAPAAKTPPAEAAAPPSVRRQRAPQPRRPLDWQRVADAAVALADEVGLERLSLRGVADRLGVSPMALYKHISDKAELDGIVITHILDRSMRDLDFAADAGWREIVRDCTVEMQRAFSLHPTMIHIFIQYPYHVKSQRLGGQMIAALKRAGFAPADAANLFGLVAMFVVGQVMTHHHYAKGKTSAGFDSARKRRIAEPATADRIMVPRSGRFEDMLDLQLDLIAARLAQTPSA